MVKNLFWCVKYSIIVVREEKGGINEDLIEIERELPNVKKENTNG